MTAPRRDRGTRIDPRTLGWEVEQVNKLRFAAIAAHSGLSASQLFDLMVEAMELDDEGYPVWLPKKPVRDREGELPIDSA